VFRRNRNLLLRLLDLDVDEGLVCCMISPVVGLMYRVWRIAYRVLVIRNRSRLRTMSFGHEAGMCLQFTI